MASHFTVIATMQGAMPKDTKTHKWNKEQPHNDKDGRITTERFERANPDKVEWMNERKGK